VTAATCPGQVECPQCGRVTQTVRRRYARHSTEKLGPLCDMSGELVSEDVIEYSRNLHRVDVVLHWAQMLREEDPAALHSWIRHTDRAELEKLLCIALAGVPIDKPKSEVFGWVLAMEKGVGGSE
jgi:hypothetical protein